MPEVSGVLPCLNEEKTMGESFNVFLNNKNQ